MNEQRRLYICASPFQFYVSLLFAYEKIECEKSIIIYLRHKNDNNNYQFVFEKLNIINIIDFKEYFIKDNLKGWKKLLFSFNLLNQIKKLNLKKDVVFIGDVTNFYFNFIASHIANQIKVTGDGASIVWNDYEYAKISFDKIILYKILGLNIPISLLNTIDRNIFLKEWKFVKKFYSKLPIKKELWLFGSSTPFVKPYSLDKYSELSKEYMKNPINENEYFKQLKNILYLNKHLRYLYFPHRNEKLQKEHEKLNVSSYNISAELLPLYLGYLPTKVIGTSTTIFSFVNIKNCISTNNIEILFTPVTEKINKIYNKYGAKELSLDYE